MLAHALELTLDNKLPQFQFTAYRPIDATPIHQTLVYALEFTVDNRSYFLNPSRQAWGSRMTTEATAIYCSTRSSSQLITEATASIHPIVRA
jgi:hypothetical protein